MPSTSSAGFVLVCMHRRLAGKPADTESSLAPWKAGNSLKTAIVAIGSDQLAERSRQFEKQTLEGNPSVNQGMDGVNAFIHWRR
jgi:hypothetical protein